MDDDLIVEVFEDAVAEMTTDPAAIVPISSEILSRVVAADDTTPQFATFVIESGWSKSNRYWGPELFNDVAAEMNQAARDEPVPGYLGHIKSEDDPYVFPEIQLQWVGAKLTKLGEKARLAVKAYAIPGTKGHEYLTHGRVKNVSWRGKVEQERFEHGVKIKRFLIESIDLARPRTAGMNARLVGISSEMQEGGDDLKPEEIGALTQNELRTHNPNLVLEIESAVKTPLETQVTEMTADAAAVQPTLDIIPQLRSLLGLADDVDDVTVLGKALSQIRDAGKTVRDSILEAVLSKKFKDEGTKKLVQRLIVSEMDGLRDFKATGNSSDDEKVVSEMVNTFIDGDEAIKAQVSEMESTPPALPTTERDRNGRRELKVGTTTSRIRVRSAR
jgi:hypothetical protein